jgi:hypothetical protein
MMYCNTTPSVDPIENVSDLPSRAIDQTWWRQQLRERNQPRQLPPPSPSVFEQYAKMEPSILNAYLNDEQLTSGMRARCAESLGLATDSGLVRQLLLPLLGSAPPLVQEGAVLALERHIDVEVRERLEQLVTDPSTSAGLRATVIEVLESIEL